MLFQQLDTYCPLEIKVDMAALIESVRVFLLPCQRRDADLSNIQFHIKSCSYAVRTERKPVSPASPPPTQ